MGLDTPRRRPWTGFVLAVSLAGMASHPSPVQAQPAARESLETAREFVAQVEAVVGGLPIDRERFAVRVNACEGRRGESRGDIYYIWVGLRGVAPAGNAADILNEVHARWREAGWNITRFRQLPNGGVNLAATEPGTGNGYVLDSGFAQDPGGYIVGFFNTGCYRSPSGPVRFGDIRLDQAR